VTLLELIYRVRLRLDDMGGDAGTPSAGFTYWWEEDDSGCLWKNAELTGYTNFAGNELAHRAPIIDSDPANAEVTRISLKAGTARYPIDSRILAIDSVVVASTGIPLVKIFDAQERSAWVDPRDTSFSEPSVVQHYREDFDSYSLTVFATPTASDTLNLTVKRLPLEPLTWTGRKNEEPEFPAHYHEALIEWVCMQALLKRDADTFDKEAAGYHQGLFTDMVGPRRDFTHTKILKDVAGKRMRTRAYY
jgi:hypothetical protein